MSDNKEEKKYKGKVSLELLVELLEYNDITVNDEGHIIYNNCFIISFNDEIKPNEIVKRAIKILEGRNVDCTVAKYLRKFTNQALHKDEEHMLWLIDECEKFIEENL